MSAAYMIAQTDKQVIVLEDGTIGGGETGRSTAHLSFAIDDTYMALQKRFGKTGARLAAESHMVAVDKIESIIQQEHIPCDFSRLNGYLFNSHDKNNLDLSAELKAAQQSGITDISLLQAAPLPGAPTGAALRFGKHAVFHPLKYLAGLARAITHMGNHIHTHTRALSIDEQNGIFTITTPLGIITARHVVVATHDPIVKCDIPKRNIAYRSYAITLPCPKDTIPYALYWDTETPYHHMRVCRHTDTEDIIVAGGGDHRTGHNGSIEESNERFTEIENWVRQFAPDIGPITHKWSGQVMEPTDYLAYIGRIRHGSNLYVITGGSGHGLTHGTIAGIILSDVITGRHNKWEAIYNPMRRLGVYKRLIPYWLGNFAQRFKFLTLARTSIDDIKPGTGAVIKQGLNWLAVHIDAKGTLHCFSARCTYSGSLLTWNALEHTWDCPTYGSRYHCLDGSVLNGPSNIPLPRI